MSIESLQNKNDLSVDEFHQLLNNEKDIKIYKKLNFLMLKKKGYSTKEAYELANLTRSLAYLTLDQWNNGGYNALLRKKGGGRTPKLNDNQLKELKTIIDTNKHFSESDIQELIMDKWDEEYTLAGVKNLLKTQFNMTLNEKDETMNDLISKSQPYLNKFENEDTDKEKGIKRIEYLISKEKNAEVLKRLFYLLLRKLGFSNGFSSKILSITTATGNNWMNRWEKRGYEGLKRKKGQGRKCKLTDEEIETLKKN